MSKILKSVVIGVVAFEVGKNILGNENFQKAVVKIGESVLKNMSEASDDFVKITESWSEKARLWRERGKVS